MTTAADDDGYRLRQLGADDVEAVQRSHVAEALHYGSVSPMRAASKFPP